MSVPCFRSLASMTASKRDQALGAGTLALLVDEWIEERFSRPPSDVPDAGEQQPRGSCGDRQSGVGPRDQVHQEHGPAP